MLNSTPFSTIPKSPFVPGTLYQQFASQQYKDSSVGKTEGTKLWSMRKAREAYRAEQALLRTLSRLESLTE